MPLKHRAYPTVAECEIKLLPVSRSPSFVSHVSRRRRWVRRVGRSRKPGYNRWNRESICCRTSDITTFGFQPPSELTGHAKADVETPFCSLDSLRQSPPHGCIFSPFGVTAIYCADGNFTCYGTCDPLPIIMYFGLLGGPTEVIIYTHFCFGRLRGFCSLRCWNGCAMICGIAIPYT
jgi:hypothetical protein